MRVIKSIKEMQNLANEAKKAGKKISFVPTMGALHKGHLELISEGRKRGDLLVVSIFVNPTQFGPNEDFNRYPRDIEGDLKKARETGVDVVFTPTIEEMYPEGFQTYVEVSKLQNHLCGIFRHGHFRGVATVVLKLFNIVKPDVAIFGEKDYQQLKIIQRMVKDLNLEIEIVGFPVVREEGGLACSSRNSYLSHEDKECASTIYRALQEMKIEFERGQLSAREITEKGKRILKRAGIEEIDYIEVCDPETLESKQRATKGDIVAVAVRIKGVRLIDNIKL
ncbi:MAG: pantothenate synthetase [Deltaproteobacteria bacterium]|nr:MAG: pantothenate synthetase [Deltaproteobacteria bacterium]